MLGLYARRETAVIHERRPHENSGRDLKPLDLLRDLVHYSRPYLPASLDFNDIDRSPRLDEQIYLAPFAPLRPALHVRRGGKDKRPLDAKVTEEIAHVVGYKILELIAELHIPSFHLLHGRVLEQSVADCGAIRLYEMKIEPCVVVADAVSPEARRSPRRRIQIHFARHEPGVFQLSERSRSQLKRKVVIDHSA